jgi:hypothetical protein
MGSRGQFARQQSLAADVCFGSKADISACSRDVRFTPKSIAEGDWHVRFVPKADIEHL